MSRATTTIASVASAIASLDATDPVQRATVDLAPVRTSGLGKKQLAWLRSNIRHFKDMEKDRRRVRREFSASFRAAGLS